ncbi:nuclear transport factor 2 family protein [Mycobacterium sp. Aquia_213]|uniref:nuclear transport factor 2 family protein n=1 Tax=Mycobacterium sp. Aquia_213 TaxID=2991728 RepID=UPI0022713BBE|nr:nuclear transport factor 2 family protein [Mycobacterium sp. Aquia_213]WAC91857.1 nuclear transport factor 2 family protein [Mycobacterium sp. Aquia_213]
MTGTDSATREANKQTLRRAMDGISALDLNAVVGELHDDVRFELPYENAVPDSGQDGIRDLLGSMFVMFEKFTITLTDIYDLLDPNMLVARYRGDALGRAKPVVYQNDYIGVFEFRDGKITLWREFDNPMVSAAMVAEFADDAGATS